ncbi:unnamed protein product, partial [Staurois parvus]
SLLQNRWPSNSRTPAIGQTRSLTITGPAPWFFEKYSATRNPLSCTYKSCSSRDSSWRSPNTSRPTCTCIPSPEPEASAVYLVGLFEGQITLQKCTPDGFWIRFCLQFTLHAVSVQF